MKFEKQFANNVCVGDRIEFELAGVRFECRLEYDNDTTPDEYECYSMSQKVAFGNGEWGFCGVVVTAYLGCWELDRESVWGVEYNLGDDNSYLTECANELLSELLQRLGVKLGEMLREVTEAAIAAIAANRLGTGIKTELRDVAKLHTVIVKYYPTTLTKGARLRCSLHGGLHKFLSYNQYDKSPALEAACEYMGTLFPNAIVRPVSYGDGDNNDTIVSFEVYEKR